MTTVVLVDDQQLVRAGIAFIISTEPGIEIVSEASNGELGVRAAVAAGMTAVRVPPPWERGL